MASFDLGEMLDRLADQELLLGVFLAGAALVFMVVGVRIQRSLVAISFGVLGFVVCSLAAGGDAIIRVLLGLFGAVALGAISTRYLKQAVVVLAGGWAGYSAAMIAGHFELSLGFQLALGAVAFGVIVALAVVMHREVAAFVLSFEGSLLMVGAVVIFLNQNPILWAHIRDMVVDYPVLGPLMLLAGTVTGFYWQMSEMRQRDAGTTS
jgi:hypothetical protein